MELRKWMLILVATAVLGKLFATGLSKLDILPNVASLERAQEKIVQIFKAQPVLTVEKPLSLPPAPVLPKTKTMAKAVLKPLPRIQVWNPVVEKKSKLLTAEEEKDRRKKRKKKLEKDADKKKAELTVVNLGDDKKPKAKVEELVTYGGFIIQPPKKKEEVPAPAPAPVSVKKVDLAAWVKLFNDQPVPATLQAFFRIYKQGQMNSAEYYSVMESLRKSSNKDVRKLSILGSSVEPHVLAYGILVHSKYSETVVELQTLAVSSLQIYKNVKHLNFLMQPLVSGDLFVKIESSDTIGAIAQNLKSSSDPTVLTADIKAILNKSIVILTPLSKDASSKELQASATKTLTLVKDILGLTT